MLLSKLSEIIWTFYQVGRVNATKQTYRQEDILELSSMCLGNMQRRASLGSAKADGVPDYYASAPLLSIQRFPLGETDYNGKRSADMSKFDLYRLPKNAHIVNVYPVSGDACPGMERGKAIDQVTPGEEYFYLGDKFNFFKFYAVKGRSLDTYHLPPCTKSVDVESTFASEEIDVSLDLAYEIAQEVLGVTLRVPGFLHKEIDNPYITPQMQQLRRNIQQPDPTIQ